MVGTAGDLVIDNYNGFIVDVGDIKNISNKINKLIDDKKTFNKMRLNTKIIIKEWSLENDVKGIISAIKYLDGEILR